ncbi:helix-turn-helix domain-containing protein [Actinomadura rayongensis]|uniref:helix-turn-helix domain-containing protein n=1 Tax=Actinomadura rayongensis TaxID=1429076 RepID=UPI0035EAC41A
MTLDPGRAGADRRQLAAALRDLRSASGLSGERLARRCHMSQSKISRIENGRTLPSITDVERILHALGADRDTGEELVRLARTANTEYQDVRASVRQGLHHRQRELAGLDADARRLSFFLPALISGLLQTPAYMKRAMDMAVEPAQGDTARAIALKLERQAVLHDASKAFDFLLTEQAVRWRLCPPETMCEQIDRIIALSRLDNVRIGVVHPGRDVEVGPMNTFTVYDDRLVTVEIFTGRVVLRDPKDIAYHRRLFAYFERHALWGDDARALLADFSREFMRERD